MPKTIETVEIWVDGHWVESASSLTAAVKMVREQLVAGVIADPRNEHRVELKFKVALVK